MHFTKILILILILCTAGFSQKSISHPILKDKITHHKKQEIKVRALNEKNKVINDLKQMLLDTQLSGANPSEDIELQVGFDWTECQIHRSDNNDDIEILLNGTFYSNNPEIWTLSVTYPESGVFPNLYFINDIFNESSDCDPIPLFWEISLNGNEYEQFSIEDNNSISYIFPSGNHDFCVRITGEMKYHQSDGYYKLVLDQNFTPQL